MLRGSIWCVVMISFALAAGAAQSAGEPQYVGAKKCRTCHKKELIGDQWSAWEKGKHSKAFETLKSDKALEIAKEKGLAKPPSESPECLKCHVTGYGEDASKFAGGKVLPNSEGIGCESCHGPGSLYKKKKTMADHDKSVAAGMWEASKDEKICLGCHNDKSPTFDAAAGFNFEERKEKIAHKIPEAVKGRYLEAEKEARGGAAGDDDEEE